MADNLGGIEGYKNGKPGSRVDENLKKMGIQFKDKELLEKYYKQLNGVLLLQASLASHAGLVLDFDALPNEPIPFKEIFVKWLIEVNMPLIENGQQPIITYELISKCPLWKVVRPPFKRLSLTKEGLFGRNSTVGKLNRKSSIGSINKRKK